jgi:ApbE superfamily uncharacterized protein (UPF0280 family)
VRRAEEALLKYRQEVEQYIYYNPHFRETYEPINATEGMSPMIRAMAEASVQAEVGPMAAVAGAIAEFVGRELLHHCKQVIVENGGDIFLKVSRPRTVGIYAGNSPLSGHVALRIEPEQTPVGICCSAGTFGHSISFGKADAVAILAESAALADAVATSIGNMIQSKDDMKEALARLKHMKGIRGGLIIQGRHMGAWGQLNIIKG